MKSKPKRIRIKNAIISCVIRNLILAKEKEFFSMIFRRIGKLFQICWVVDENRHDEQHVLFNTINDIRMIHSKKGYALMWCCMNFVKDYICYTVCANVLPFNVFAHQSHAISWRCSWCNGYSTNALINIRNLTNVAFRFY